MLAGLLALGAAGGAIVARMQDVAARRRSSQTARPRSSTSRAIGPLMWEALVDDRRSPSRRSPSRASSPASSSTSLQVGLKPSPKAAKPDPKRINPLQGVKQLFGPNALVEGGKSIAKVVDRRRRSSPPR